jgi:hypothetical protein
MKAPYRIVAALVLALASIWGSSYATLELPLDDWRFIPMIATAAMFGCCSIGLAASVVIERLDKLPVLRQPLRLPFRRRHGDA